MASRFFENFKDAAKIYPGWTIGANADGNIKLSGGQIRNINLPSANDNDGGNTAAYDQRVAVPFRYKTYDHRGGYVDNSGVLYMPAYEATRIKATGIVKDAKKPIEIYGAEMNGQSLTKDGFLDVFYDDDNSDFKFDIQTAREALDSASNSDAGSRASTAQPFQADANNGAFVRNLRSALWGKGIWGGKNE